MKYKELPMDYLHSRLDYEPTTGNLIWKTQPEFDRFDRMWNTRYAGTVAGSRKYYNGKPHDIRVKVDYVLYSVHRFIWAMTYGEWVACAIDHIDGNPFNNKLDNLRLATVSQNCCNQGVRRNNSTGHKGVSFHKPTGRFRARIMKHNKSHILGYFNSPEEAGAAYALAAAELHGDFARLA
jgi:hypothetical protein